MSCCQCPRSCKLQLAICPMSATSLPGWQWHPLATAHNPKSKASTHIQRSPFTLSTSLPTARLLCTAANASPASCRPYSVSRTRHCSAELLCTTSPAAANQSTSRCTLQPSGLAPLNATAGKQAGAALCSALRSMRPAKNDSTLHRELLRGLASGTDVTYSPCWESTACRPCSCVLNQPHYQQPGQACRCS